MVTGVFAMIAINFLIVDYEPKIIHISLYNIIWLATTCTFGVILEEFIFYERHSISWLPSLKDDNIYITCIIFALAHSFEIIMSVLRHDSYLMKFKLIIWRLLALAIFRYNISSQSNIYYAIIYHIFVNILCWVIYLSLICYRYTYWISQLGFTAVEANEYKKYSIAFPR